MREIPFTKMHCAGNDFVVFDGFRSTVPPSEAVAKHLGHRRFGVGADQVLWIGPARSETSDFHYRIFNTDGSEAEMCGNGARAVATYAHRHGLTTKSRLVFDVMKGVIAVEMDEAGVPSLHIGAPDFGAEAVSYQGGRLVAEPTPIPCYRGPEGAADILFSTVSLGNPHAVVRLPDFESWERLPAVLGPILEKDAGFQFGANVGFLWPYARDKAKLVVWERGCGLTLSCGSGACAAAAVGVRMGWLNNAVQLEMPGGTLNVFFDGERDLVLKGRATVVFEGVMTMPGDE